MDLAKPSKQQVKLTTRLKGAMKGAVPAFGAIGTAIFGMAGGMILLEPILETLSPLFELFSTPNAVVL